MLPSLNRIDRRTMQRLKKPTQVCVVGYIHLAWFPADGVWKVGVVVSKKVSKNAVDRNRIRRSLYEVTREFMYISPSGYYMVRLKKGAKNKSLKKMRSDLHVAFVDITQTR